MPVLQFEAPIICNIIIDERRLLDLNALNEGLLHYNFASQPCFSLDFTHDYVRSRDDVFVREVGA